MYDGSSNTAQASGSPRGKIGSLAWAPASIAIALLSWTYPRVGSLKFSELFALIASPRALIQNSDIRPLLKCYLPFFLATGYSLFVAMLMVGRGDNTLSSEKGMYASPTLVPFATLLRICVYLLAVTATTTYFAVSDQEKVSRTLRWAYYATLFPGILQVFRIYSGIYFNIPFFERIGVGPFSGVFNSGFLRLMGFEIEPLAYASSLVTVCCLSMYNGRRIPWLGTILLLHTLGAGAMFGLLLALLVTTSRNLVRLVVPIYAAGLGLLCVLVRANIKLIAAISFLTGSISERLFATNACTNMWLDHPWGVGLGLYGYFYNHYDVIGSFPAASLDWYPNNDPMMFLVYGGLLFLGAYLYTFYFVLHHARSYWLFVACAAIMFQSLSAYIFFNPATIVVFSIILANAEPIPARQAATNRQLISLGPLRIFPFGVRFLVRKAVTKPTMNRA